MLCFVIVALSLGHPGEDAVGLDACGAHLCRRYQIQRLLHPPARGAVLTQQLLHPPHAHQHGSARRLIVGRAPQQLALCLQGLLVATHHQGLLLQRLQQFLARRLLGALQQISGSRKMRERGLGLQPYPATQLLVQPRRLRGLPELLAQARQRRARLLLPRRQLAAQMVGSHRAQGAQARRRQRLRQQLHQRGVREAIDGRRHRALLSHHQIQRQQRFENGQHIGSTVAQRRRHPVRNKPAPEQCRGGQDLLLPRCQRVHASLQCLGRAGRQTAGPHRLQIRYPPACPVCQGTATDLFGDEQIQKQEVSPHPLVHRRRHRGRLLQVGKVGAQRSFRLLAIQTLQDQTGLLLHIVQPCATLPHQKQENR